MIFVDSNVLIDVLTQDQSWFAWSSGKLTNLSGEDTFVINPVVIAELASNFPDLMALYGTLASIDVYIEPFDDEVAFLAGQAFRAYRRRHSGRDAILSDFLIGGHALHLQARLLTRDAAIYRAYFPDLALITPETDNG